MADNTTDSRGDMKVSEAGELGGKKTSATHGKEFFKRIGEEGGKARHKNDMKNERKDKDAA